MQTVPVLRVEVLNSAHASCLETGEQLRAPCEGHVLKLAVRPPPTALLLHGSSQGWCQCLSEQHGSRFLGFFFPLQRLLPPCESGIFCHLSSSAPNLILEVQKSLFWFVSQCLSCMLWRRSWESNLWQGSLSPLNHRRDHWSNSGHCKGWEISDVI